MRGKRETIKDRHTVRYLAYDNVVYVRLKDMVELLDLFSSTETVEVRNRLSELTNNLLRHGLD